MSDLNELLAPHIASLVRYASALIGDPEEACDLVKDALSNAEAREDEWRRDSDLRVWLLTLLHEEIDNPFRRSDPLGSVAAPVLEPEASLQLSDLDRALRHLPEGQRAVILLIGLEGMSYENTAAILGISVGAMRWRMTRARDQLRRMLGVDEEQAQDAA